MSADTVERYRLDFEARESALPGAALPWLRAARREALERFAGLGFPRPREEAWKYTRVAPIEKRGFEPGAAADVPAETIAPHHLPGDAHRLVFVDGRHAPALSDPGALPEGVRLDALATALECVPDLLRAHIERRAGADRHAFTALNTAFMSDCACLHLARGAVVTRPVHLLFVSSARSENAVAHPRVLVVAEPGSEVAVVETHVALGDAVYFSNCVTEVVVGAGARVEHCKLQHESERAFHVATLAASLDADGRFESHSISLGGALTRNDIDVSLDAEGAQCTLNGLYMVGGRQHVDFHTRIDHRRPGGTSREHYKGILSGHARGVFNGQVHVHPDAQKSDASQSNDNLLLSRDAEVDTKPQLEINADDVKCAHGATVGQLDEDALFYLRARGIAAETARGLLTYGFAQDIVDRVGVAPVRERLTETLLGRIPQASTVRELVR